MSLPRLTVFILVAQGIASHQTVLAGAERPPRKDDRCAPICRANNPNP
jgi:hypothetical protein